MEKYTGMTLKDLGDGRWQARFSYKDGDRWKWKSRNFRAPSERAARREAAARRAELEEEAAREALPLGMGDDELLLPRFLEAYIRSSEGAGGIEPTTATNYRHTAAHICRHLSSWRVDELTPQAILAMQEGLLEDGLCSDSVAKDHRLLKQALSYAVETGALAKSPFTKSLKAPKRRRREPNALDDSERQRLLAALDSMVDSELTLAVRLGLSAGLRREEICGLRWRDVDFQRDLILVRNAVTEAAGHSFEKGPKSETSRRDIPLEPDLKARLEAKYKRVLASSGKAKAASRYVIETSEGRWYLPSRLGKEFSSLARSLDLVGTTGKRVTLHDLRHTYATFLIARGVDVKTVASLMGHADATVTLNVYASADPTARQQAADVVAEAMAERPRRDEGPRRPLLRVV
jgi:integrase